MLRVGGAAGRFRAGVVRLGAVVPVGRGTACGVATTVAGALALPPEPTVVHGLAARYLVGRDDVTAVELARYLGITKQSTSEVVTALEHAGIVRRAPHPTDRRARVLLLSDAGAKKLADGRERWKELEDDWAALVGRDQLDVVRSALAAYLDAEGDRHVTGDCSSSC